MLLWRGLLLYGVFTKLFEFEDFISFWGVILPVCLFLADNNFRYYNVQIIYNFTSFLMAVMSVIGEGKIIFSPSWKILARTLNRLSDLIVSVKNAPRLVICVQKIINKDWNHASLEAYNGGWKFIKECKWIVALKSTDPDPCSLLNQLVAYFNPSVGIFRIHNMKFGMDNAYPFAERIGWDVLVIAFDRYRHK